MDKTDITILVCSHNRTEGLRESLETLIRQETDGKFSYEVVVVHTGTTGTPEVIEQARLVAGVPVRGVHQPHRGAVVARNRGLKESRGEWLALFDDDQTAEPYWLKELWKIAKEKNSRCVGGVLRLRLPKDCTRQLTPRCRRMLGETVAWTTAQPYTRREGPGSGNEMIHRSVFDELGEFDDSFALCGYDTDFYRRIRKAGIECWFTPRAEGFHVIPQYRLEEKFFKETSLHNGWSFARRDRLERGNTAALGIAVARLGQAALVNLPRLLLVRLGGDREKILDAKSRLWRAEGYARSTLYAIAPAWFRQQRFFSRYEFRAERQFAGA